MTGQVTAEVLTFCAVVVDLSGPDGTTVTDKKDGKKLDEAIDQYKDAWKQTQEALKKA